MRRLLLLSALLLLGLLTPVLGQKAPTETPKPAYDPAKTRVAILPVVNKADEFNKSFQEKIKAQAQKALTERFTLRGFEVVEQSVVDKAVEETKFDGQDRENWHTNTILPLGKKLNARLILLCVVTDAHNKTNNTFLTDILGVGGAKEGIATVRAYLVDTENGKTLLNGTSKQGKSSGAAFGNFDKGMDRQARAVVRGFDIALHEFLAAYPLLNKPR
jgi:hypothetical protein